MTLISYEKLKSEVAKTEHLLSIIPHWKVSEKLRLKLRANQMKSLLNTRNQA